jgi:hypothetical protein
MAELARDYHKTGKECIRNFGDETSCKGYFKDREIDGRIPLDGSLGERLWAPKVKLTPSAATAINDDLKGAIARLNSISLVT